MWVSVLSQWSFQTLIESPLPITNPSFRIRRSLPAIMLLQPWEQSLVGFIDRKGAFLQYFPKKPRASGPTGFVTIHHACFANSALLNNCKSRTSKPPKSLGLVIRSHDTQHIFFLPSHASHQNLVRAYWIRLRRLTGNWKQVIAYVGMAERTAFSMTSFPALERCRGDQLFARRRIRSTMLVNGSLLRRPKCSGNPRYLPTPPSFSIPR